MPNILQRTISRAARGTVPFTRGRSRALAKIRWVLATDDGRFVRVDNCGCASLVREAARAAVYDGRDNEELKARFFRALFGVPFTVVLLD